MNPKPIPKVLLLIPILVLAVALGLVISHTRADMGDPGGNLTLEQGRLAPVGGYAETSGLNLQAASQSFGPLVYDDFKHVEAQAREKLEHGLEARLALSPYQGNIEFTQYVTRFDYEANFSREYTGTNPYADTLTMMDLINFAEQDLRQARDLYGYLAVYAPEERFRADPEYITTVLPGYTDELCGTTNKEDPDPEDPLHSGLVIDPVIDWCDFTARLRQSVREAANLRMIFGQQFMADALGLQFSGTTLIGAEDAVRQETARLRAAKYQYELAEEALNEALDRNLGSGCYVSDFFQQSEWALFSRAIEGQETAQHQLAIRLSYLDVPQEPDGPQQSRTAGVNALRQASMNGYIKLIGMAGLGAGQPTGEGCAKGVQPDGALAAEMAVNLAETRRKANEMAAGRNVFGFDVTFTPARPYNSSVPMTCDTSANTRGLWDEAYCAAEQAQKLQDAEATAKREYNNAQEKLRNEVENIRTGIDAEVYAQSGCDGGDWACVDTQIEALDTCLGLVGDTQGLPSTLPTGPFDVCINDSAINDSEAKRALLDLRGIFIQQYSLVIKAQNINERILHSNDANAIVTLWLGTSGSARTAADVSQAALDMVGCSASSGIVVLWTFGCLGVGNFNVALQAVAGAVSTIADINIENAKNEEETSNLLLDQSEVVIDAYAAWQQYQSKLSEYHTLRGNLLWNVSEAKRLRAYFEHSPANDPSYRILRDSTRLQFANQLAYASRMTYLAARRAEYEYAARLNASNLRFSDIYRSRTAADLLTFLDNLRGLTGNLPGSGTTVSDLTFSVAQHWLNLTDEVLESEGYTTPEAIQAERTRRFRLWVAENTVANDFESPYDGKDVLKFSFTTSLVEGGTFTRLIPQGYDGYWLLKLSGIGEPVVGSNGLSLNLVTEQAGMSYRSTRVTQGGVMHLRSFAGCIFDYRLIAPTVMLGQEWASNQSPEEVTASFNANVNEAHAYTENSFRTSVFQGRGASATDWQVLVFSGAPNTGLSDMDLQQLTDIEINFSITYASRDEGEPEPSDCTRIDW
jgi:hypothetical protein